MLKMKQLIASVLLIVNYGCCNLNGIYLNTGGCPQYTPATNVDVDKCSTVWTVEARSGVSYVETRLDCTRMSLILNNDERNEIALYARPRGTFNIRGFQGVLGFAVSRHIGYYNILNVIGVTPFYLRGSVWILDTDNETYCILVMCNSQLNIGSSFVYVLTRGPSPDNLVQITKQVLLENKMNPEGLLWGMNRNC